MFEIMCLAIVAGMMYWCYTIAKSNGRNKNFALFMGFLFGLWAIIFYYSIGKSQDTLKAEIKEELNK
jgi:CDP-diglyceride synthetase